MDLVVVVVDRMVANGCLVAVVYVDWGLFGSYR